MTNGKMHAFLKVYKNLSKKEKHAYCVENNIDIRQLYRELFGKSVEFKKLKG
tara:strand:+ start:1612 stop:1767 length:156 start_codon:yes stop_codon:yes gene_type:complete